MPGGNVLERPCGQQDLGKASGFTRSCRAELHAKAVVLHPAHPAADLEGLRPRAKAQGYDLAVFWNVLGEHEGASNANPLDEAVVVATVSQHSTIDGRGDGGKGVASLLSIDS